MSAKQMHLGFLMYSTGGHASSWRCIENDVRTSIEYYKRLARTAEEAKFDMVFRADVPGARSDHLDTWSRYPLGMNELEPLTLLSALAGATSHIGLAATVSTSFAEPYNVARQMASLDHISGGRAGWNVVTSASIHAARNFGYDAMPSHKDRYERAREFVKIVKSLWDTYEDDTIIFDRAGGRYFDPHKFHVLDWASRHFHLHGALNLARCPQGQPVIIQAGQSEDGKVLAAETAEVIFATGTNLTKSQAFYREMRDRCVACGRSPDSLRILNSLNVITGDTAEAANARYAALEDMVHIEVRVRHLSDDIGIDLSGLPLDKPIPSELFSGQSNLYQSFHASFVELARQDLSLEEVARRYKRGVSALAGTPHQIADHMEQWVAEGACDGFMMIFQSQPTGLDDFCRQVIPELQRRGVFRKQYEGKTLREHLGLERPKWRHAF